MLWLGLVELSTVVRGLELGGWQVRGGAVQFGSLKYERLFLEEMDDVFDLVTHAERRRVDYNTVRPHEALSWNRPNEPAEPQLSRARNPASYLMRGTRTCGRFAVGPAEPIPDTDAYPGALTSRRRTQRNDRLPEHGVDRPCPFRDGRQGRGRSIHS